jgi:hypothetical protein
MIQLNPNWGPSGQGVANSENPLQIFDPNNQSICQWNGTYQPFARNIATGLCHQFIHKNNNGLSKHVFTPEVERYIAWVLYREDRELYNSLSAGLPPGHYAWHRVQNTKALRDALNKVP